MRVDVFSLFLSLVLFILFCVVFFFVSKLWSLVCFVFMEAISGVLNHFKLNEDGVVAQHNPRI